MRTPKDILSEKLRTASRGLVVFLGARIWANTQFARLFTNSGGRDSQRARDMVAVRLGVSKAVSHRLGCIQLQDVADGTSRTQGMLYPRVANRGLLACRCEGEKVLAHRLGAMQEAFSPVFSQVTGAQS